MALCWPATPSEVKFAADSLLEKAGFEPSVPLTKEWNPGGTVEMMPQFGCGPRKKPDVSGRLS
jgi:hypothetical protein